MELVKIKDKSNGAVITVKKSLAGDYIGTGKFEIYKEEKEKPTFKFEGEKDKLEK